MKWNIYIIFIHIRYILLPPGKFLKTSVQIRGYDYRLCEKLHTLFIMMAWENLAQSIPSKDNVFRSGRSRLDA